MPDLDLGKYAAFIWPAYAITAAVFLIMIAASLNHARRWKARVEALTAQSSTTGAPRR